jgi:hypothetical protein
VRAIWVRRAKGTANAAHLGYRVAMSGGASNETLTGPPEVIPGEREILLELHWPVVSDSDFSQSSLAREISRSLCLSRTAIGPHVGNPCEKFGVFAEEGKSRQVQAENEVMRREAVQAGDVRSIASS